MAIGYFLSMWVKPVTSLPHRLFTPSRRCPNPNLPYLEPSQGLPRVAKCPMSYLPWGQKSFPGPTGQLWVLQTSGTPGNLSTFHFIWLLSPVPQGMRMASSAVVLKKVFPCSCHCWKGLTALSPPVVGGSSHLLRGLPSDEDDCHKLGI